VTLRARWVTLRARWVTLRARWVTLRARWVTLRARWVTLRARWVTQQREPSTASTTWPPVGADEARVAECCCGEGGGWGGGAHTWHAAAAAARSRVAAAAAATAHITGPGWCTPIIERPLFTSGGRFLWCRTDHCRSLSSLQSSPRGPMPPLEGSPVPYNPPQGTELRDEPAAAAAARDAPAAAHGVARRRDAAAVDAEHTGGCTAAHHTGWAAASGPSAAPPVST
jgi:hypothetical protein